MEIGQYNTVVITNFTANSHSKIIIYISGIKSVFVISQQEATEQGSCSFYPSVSKTYDGHRNMEVSKQALAFYAYGGKQSLFDEIKTFYLHPTNASFFFSS